MNRAQDRIADRLIDGIYVLFLIGLVAFSFGLSDAGCEHSDVPLLPEPAL